MTEKTIGFIGMGLMGTPMSLRLLAAGYDLIVWNRSKIKSEELELQGVNVATTIKDIVQECDILMTCLTDTAAVEAVVFSKEFIQAANNTKVLVDFSSIDPGLTKQFAEKLSRLTGMRWIDCPVSGGVIGAESGSLVMMAGGDEKTIDSLRPALNHLAQRVTHMGPVGSGQATKVCNQMIVSCNVLIMAEVLALAEKTGIDSQKIPAALAGGFADSLPFQVTGQRMADKSFDEIKWHVKTLAKDLDLAAVMATTNTGHTPMASLAQRLMRQYCDEGYAELDPANLITAYSD